MLIQAINGHAWPEIYLEGIGWTIVDPAPSRTLVDMSVDPQNSLQQLLGDMLRDEASFDEFIASQARYYLHTIECFGPERCMFESNFPVDRLSVSYGVLWNAYKKMTADFTANERAALFSGTAARVYKV